MSICIVITGVGTNHNQTLPMLSVHDPGTDFLGGGCGGVRTPPEIFGTPPEVFSTPSKGFCTPLIVSKFTIIYTI